MRTNAPHFLRIGVAIMVLLLANALPVSALNPAPGQTVVLHPAAASNDLEIQRALDQLPPGGGTVVLAPGVYDIHDPIQLNRSGLTLSGSGNNTVLRLADHADCPVVILGPTERKPAVIVHDLRLAGLFIDGNRSHQLKEQWRDPCNTSGIQNDGIIIQGVNHATIEQVVAAHCRSGGLVTANGARHLTVSEFTAFDNQFDGLACYQTEDSLFTKLNLHDNQCAGISLDLAFDHNVISNATLTGNDLGIFMRESFNNQFRDLTISHSRHDGVFMAQWVTQAAQGWEYVPQTECSGNQFDGLKIQGCAGDAFCIHDPGCAANVVQDEMFSGNLSNRLEQAYARVVHPPGLLSAKD